MTELFAIKIYPIFPVHFAKLHLEVGRGLLYLIVLIHT